MTTNVVAPAPILKSGLDAKLSKKPGKIGTLAFLGALVVGLAYVGTQLIGDLGRAPATDIFPYILLIIALLVALGFEFVNGFHDTANAVATVILHALAGAARRRALVGRLELYRRSSVLGRGRLRHRVPSSGRAHSPGWHWLRLRDGLRVAGRCDHLEFLGTWWLGLPSSSSHTLIGSIIGVGLANQMMAANGGTSGVDWGQAGNVGKSLLFSPLIGFVAAGLLLLLAKALIPNKRLYEAPVGNAPPPFWIRALLVLTCTGVSFAHGSNDGQKGMGLIMLILIGTVPTAYALNHAVPASHSIDFVAVSTQTVEALGHYDSSPRYAGDQCATTAREGDRDGQLNAALLHKG